MELDKDDPTKFPAQGAENPLTVYRGESSRSCFRRGQSHLNNYTSRDHKRRDKSCLWKHTRDVHGGILGDDGGLSDYGMTYLSQDSRPLDRLVKEGSYIQDLENKEALGQAVCLNSKQDFIQSCRVSLDFRRGEINDT